MEPPQLHRLAETLRRAADEFGKVEGGGYEPSLTHIYPYIQGDGEWPLAVGFKVSIYYGSLDGPDGPVTYTIFVNKDGRP